MSVSEVVLRSLDKNYSGGPLRQVKSQMYSDIYMITETIGFPSGDGFVLRGHSLLYHPRLPVLLLPFLCTALHLFGVNAIEVLFEILEIVLSPFLSSYVFRVCVCVTLKWSSSFNGLCNPSLSQPKLRFETVNIQPYRISLTKLKKFEVKEVDILPLLSE